MNQPPSLPDSNSANQNRLTTRFSEPWLKRLLQAMGEADGKAMMMSGCSITELDRRRLEALVEGTRRSLTPQPGERRGLAVVLAKLLAAFPAQSQSDAPASQRVDAYFEALADVPLQFADEARQDVVCGRAPEHSGAWAPTPPQFAAICRRMMEDERVKLRQVERLLTAKPYDEIDFSENVATGLDQLLAKLAAAAKAMA